MKKRGNAPLLVLVAAAVFAGGCEEEKRIISQRSILGSLAGAKSGIPESPGPVPASAALFAEPADGKLVIENPDGSKTLVIRTARHLMFHIIATIDAGEEDLFNAQVLAGSVRQDFAVRGRPKGEYFALLKKNRDAIAALFGRMPMGEHTPSVRMLSAGKNTTRILFTGPTDDLAVVGFDMVFENLNWRLVRFIPARKGTS